MRCTEEPSQVWVVTGNTAGMINAVKMYGSATGFVCFNLSALLDGRSPVGLSFQRDSTYPLHMLQLTNLANPKNSGCRSLTSSTSNLYQHDEFP